MSGSEEKLAQKFNNIKVYVQTPQKLEILLTLMCSIYGSSSNEINEPKDFDGHVAK